VSDEYVLGSESRESEQSEASPSGSNPGPRIVQRRRYGVVVPDHYDTSGRPCRSAALAGKHGGFRPIDDPTLMLSRSRSVTTMLSRLGAAVETVVFGRYADVYERFVRTVYVGTAGVVVVGAVWIVDRIGDLGLFGPVATDALTVAAAVAVTLFTITGVVQLLVLARVLERSTEEVAETADELEATAAEIEDAAAVVEAAGEDVAKESETVETVSEEVAEKSEAVEELSETVAEGSETVAEGSERVATATEEVVEEVVDEETAAEADLEEAPDPVEEAARTKDEVAETAEQAKEAAERAKETRDRAEQAKGTAKESKQRSDEARDRAERARKKSREVKEKSAQVKEEASDVKETLTGDDVAPEEVVDDED